MKIDADDNELRISETPAILWLVGLFFASIGACFVYGGLGGFSNADQYGPLMAKIAALMGFVGVGVGIWVIQKSPVTRVVADRLSRRISITRFSLKGKSVDEFAFDEIRGFLLLEGRDSEGDKIWTFSMRLANDDVVEIAAIGLHSEDFEREYVFRANEFVGKQLTATEMILDGETSET